MTIEVYQEQKSFYPINATGVDMPSLPIAELPDFIAAWNRYKHAAAAVQLVKIPDLSNPTIACNSAFRLDEYLGFLAGEKLKELAELGGEGWA